MNGTIGGFNEAARPPLRGVKFASYGGDHGGGMGGESGGRTYPIGTTMLGWVIEIFRGVPTADRVI